VGSNAKIVSDKTELFVDQIGLDEVWTGARKLVPSLSKGHAIAVFAGLRASGNAACSDSSVDYHGDFLIERSVKPWGLITLAGIESPGLTAAPALALRVVELLRDGGEKLIEKPDWQPCWSDHLRDNESQSKDRADQLQRVKYKVVPDWFR
jgi:glycerol-3-phosphate dehydrogenase